MLVFWALFAFDVDLFSANAVFVVSLDVQFVVGFKSLLVDSCPDICCGGLLIWS